MGMEIAYFIGEKNPIHIRRFIITQNVAQVEICCSVTRSDSLINVEQ